MTAFTSLRNARTFVLAGLALFGTVASFSATVSPAQAAAARYTAKALELDAAVNSGVPDGEAVATLSFVKGACTPIGLLLWSMLITFASVEVTLLVASAGLAAGCAAVWTSYNRHARATAAPSAS